MQGANSGQGEPAACNAGLGVFVCACFDAFVWLFNGVVAWWVAPKFAGKFHENSIQVPPLTSLLFQWRMPLAGLCVVFAVAALTREIAKLPEADKKKVGWFSIVLAVGVMGVMGWALLLAPQAKGLL